MASKILKACTNSCVACTSCSCNTEGRPFPWLFAFALCISLLAIIPGVIIAFTHLNNDCQKPWQVYLIIYCILFVFNLFFGWYLNWRFYNPRMKATEGDKEAGACARCARMTCHDPGVGVFMLLFLFDLIWNIVVGYVWASDTDCASLQPTVFNMTRACFVFMWVFLGGTVVFGVVTVCCDCMSAKPKKDDIGAAGATKEAPPADNTPWHAGTETTPVVSQGVPQRRASSSPVAARQSLTVRDPNVPQWYTDATGSAVI